MPLLSHPARASVIAEMHSLAPDWLCGCRLRDCWFEPTFHKHAGKLCHGVNLSNMSDEEIWKRGIDLSYVIDAYRNLNMDDHFFRSFFELLIGTDYVRKMIKEGKSAEEIKARWKDDVEKFKVQRKPYLLYEE